MGKRGPPPKPTALKKLQGTFRPDRAPSNEFKPAVGAPAKPDYLDDIASAQWDRVVAQLSEHKVLATVDGAALEAFCVNYSAAVRFQKRADAKPMVKTPFGVKVNPACGEARKHWALVKQFGAEFGLTPSSRTRVGTKPPADKKDETADFLFGGGKAPLKLVSGGKGGKGGEGGTP